MSKAGKLCNLCGSPLQLQQLGQDEESPKEDSHDQEAPVPKKKEEASEQQVMCQALMGYLSDKLDMGSGEEDQELRKVLEARVQARYTLKMQQEEAKQTEDQKTKELAQASSESFKSHEKLHKR